MLIPLRGDFFCLPFGGNGDPFEHVKYPPHGEPVGKQWNLASDTIDKGLETLTLNLKSTLRPGNITKKIMLLDGQSVIYTQEILEGFSGVTTLGHHAILNVPEKEGSIRIATSKFQLGMTSPVLFSNPVNREYQSFAIGMKFDDLRGVPLDKRESGWRGGGSSVSKYDKESLADCTSFPARIGFADLLGLASEPAEKLDQHIAWTTATNQDGGYIWFSFRDPGMLPMTVFWIENHGRHGPPWNGRNRCLGLEDVCSYFNEGVPVSAEPNLLNKAGIPTTQKLSPDQPTLVNYVQGVVKIPADFIVVKSVEFAPGEATFVSENGRRVTAKVNWEFVKSGKLP